MKLEERITVLGLIDAKQPNGEVISSEAVKFECWAQVIPLSGEESFEGDKKQSEQNFKIRIRHRKDLSVEDSINWSGFKMDIRAVTPYLKAGRNKYIEIKARQII